MKALLLVLALQDPAAEKLKPLLEGLRAESIEARDEAYRAILEMADAALPVLKALPPAEDAEVAARVKSAIAEIQKSISRRRVYRPSRPVTVHARDLPLRDVVTDLCGQADVASTLSREAEDRRVSFDAADEPLLRALDRLCAAQGDLAVQMVDGRIYIAREKSPPQPAAYVDGFRARLKLVRAVQSNDFANPTTAYVLYIAFDAQPDLKPVSSTYAAAPEGRAAGGEIRFKTSDQAGRMGAMGARGVVTLDDVVIPYDADNRVESACYVKEAPAGVRKLDSLKVRARYRFSAATRAVRCKLTRSGGETTIENLPLRASIMSTYVRLEPGAGYESRLGDLIDLDALAIVTKDGKEEKLFPMNASPRLYLFRANVDATMTDELKLSVLDDVFEKEAEFTFENVTLRD